MEQIGKIIQATREKNSRIHTPEQALADEIWEYFGKALPFPRIMRMIKLKGLKKTYEAFNAVRQSDARDHLSLFIFKWKNLK